MAGGLKHLSGEEKLEQLCFFSLEKRWPWGYLIAAFLCLRGGYKKDKHRLFSMVKSRKMRDNKLKLEE